METCEIPGVSGVNIERAVPPRLSLILPQKVIVPARGSLIGAKCSSRSALGSSGSLVCLADAVGSQAAPFQQRPCDRVSD